MKGKGRTMKVKMVYTKFDVDFIKKFSIIVQAPSTDARADAYNVLGMQFGNSARIVGQGKVIKELPANVQPALKTDWAWYQL